MSTVSRRWLVKDADGVIGGFTDDDNSTAPLGYTAAVIPLDATGVPTDGPRSGGVWTAATSTYTLSLGEVNAASPAVINAFHKKRLHEAYLYWRRYGRADHWVHLRSGPLAAEPMTATDRWTFQLPAVMLNAITGDYPRSITLKAAQLQALADHLVNILEHEGPLFYGLMVSASGLGGQRNNAFLYASQGVATDGAAMLHTDVIHADGTPRNVDGSFLTAGVIPLEFNPELVGLVNP